MNKKAFSPYIRVAMLSTLIAPFIINERIIFDYEIILVKDGKCKITIDGIDYICKKNDVVFLRPGIPHKFESVENTDFVQPHIHFDISYSDKSEETPVSFKAREVMSDYELSLIQKNVFEMENIPYVFVPYNPDKFKKIFFEIITLFQEKAYNYELLYKAKLLELLDCILYQFEDNKTNGTETIAGTVVAVKNYIDNNYLSVITLDFLAAQFGLNKYTLMRKFSSMYKQTVISYYRNKRIEYAMKILRTTDVSVNSLAEKLNFSDIYSFSRFFKMYVGCSPTAYRMQSAKYKMQNAEPTDLSP